MTSATAAAAGSFASDGRRRNRETPRGLYVAAAIHCSRRHTEESCGGRSQRGARLPFYRVAAGGTTPSTPPTRPSAARPWHGVHLPPTPHDRCPYIIYNGYYTSYIRDTVIYNVILYITIIMYGAIITAPSSILLLLFNIIIYYGVGRRDFQTPNVSELVLWCATLAHITIDIV